MGDVKELIRRLLVISEVLSESAPLDSQGDIAQPYRGWIARIEKDVKKLVEWDKSSTESELVVVNDVTDGWLGGDLEGDGEGAGPAVEE